MPSLKFFQQVEAINYARSAFKAAGLNFDAALAAKDTAAITQLRVAVQNKEAARPSRSQSAVSPSPAQPSDVRRSGPAPTGVDRARASFQKDADAIAAKIYPPRGK